MLRVAAGFGDDIKRLRAIDISIAADTPEGTGVCGQAFRDQKTCISNDYLNDRRSLAWREGANRAHISPPAAPPLTRGRPPPRLPPPPPPAPPSLPQPLLPPLSPLSPTHS